MEYVIHNNWGVGTIVRREIRKDDKFVEVESGGNYITVHFVNGKTTKFAIPVSFEKGVIRAMGHLEDEVSEAASQLEREREEDKARHGIFGNALLGDEKETRTEKNMVKIDLTGLIKADFKTYLKAAGYEPSVVTSYFRSIILVSREEKITTKALLESISTIIRKYDKGGEKERLGNYQNKTVINALRRFREFGISNPEVLLKKHTYNGEGV